MYGGSGKMGRGGGGGGGKRNTPAPPPINRAAASTGRLSMGGVPRGGRGGAAATSSLHVEERFSLVRENPLNFGMAIKLTPDLVEEIKRVEGLGGTARIKFDANVNNSNGNVINVGDKNFKFTWSREPGDLCDIYEERRSGEDGNGLLVESGGTWRKLNVERELDESTQNHLKRRSEEAERKLKSRKSIILDPQNPSMKNQMKALAAAESNPWRNFKHRREPPLKKPKSETPSGTAAAGPLKSVYKSGLPVTTVSTGKLSSGSPMSSQPDQHGSAIPSGSANLKGNASTCAPAHVANRIVNSDKEIHSRLTNSTNLDKSKHNRNTLAKPADLRSLMISVLLDHQPKGLSLKALEKVIGDAMPNSSRQMEPLLKQIAVFQAPGRYFLKPGVEMESFKKPPSQTGSSPEIYHQQSFTPQKFDQLPVQDSGFPIKRATNNEEQSEYSMPVHTSNTIEKIDILHNSLEYVSDKKVSENSAGFAGSGSDSRSNTDSDNESDSSDSDSDSGSHSRSKSLSPVGSWSGSSSDSGSDASSSSKQASDQEVDIMSDGEKESKQTLQNSDAAALKFSVQLSHQDNEPVDVGIYNKLEGQCPDVIEIEKDFPELDFNAGRRAGNCSYPNRDGEDLVEAIRTSSTDHQQERQVCDEKAYDGPDSVANDVVGQSANQENLSKGRTRRCYDDKHSDERGNRNKIKTKDSIHPVSGTINSIFGESPSNSSPEMPVQGPEKGPVNVTRDRTSCDGNDDPNSQTCFNQVTPTRSAPDSHQPGQRSFEARIWSEAPGEKRPGKHDSLIHGRIYFEQNLHTNENPNIQKAFNTEAEREDGLFSDKRPVKFSAENVVDKHATMTETRNRKPEMLGKIKEAGTHFNTCMRYPPKDNNVNIPERSPVMNGQVRVLRREHSDLELGEFRESFHDETPVPKKQLERKGSFNQLDNRSMDHECRNSDFSRGKPSNKITADLGKLSPPNSDAVSGIPDGPSKRKVPGCYVDDLTRPHRKSTRPLDQHHQSWGEQTEVGSQHNKVSEMSGKSRFAEAGTGEGPSFEAYGDTSRKVSVNLTEQQHESIPGIGQRTTKESKKHKKPIVVGDANGGQKDASLIGNSDGIKRTKESSLGDSSCSYTKFEKEEPELKAPISSVSQYKEYVKEYQEKYESYCSLNKILEAYRNEFGKLGKDLAAFKGNDMKRYHEILERMRSSFRQCGETHKRQKKIFVVLYEELKHLKQMIKEYAATYKKG